MKMKAQRRPHGLNIYAGDLDKKNVNDGKIDFFLVSWRADARASGGAGISIFL